MALKKKLTEAKSQMADLRARMDNLEALVEKFCDRYATTTEKISGVATDRIVEVFKKAAKYVEWSDEYAASSSASETRFRAEINEIICDCFAGVRFEKIEPEPDEGDPNDA